MSETTTPDRWQQLVQGGPGYEPVPSPHYKNIAELPDHVRQIYPELAQWLWLEIFNRAFADRGDRNYASKQATIYFTRGEHCEFVVYPDQGSADPKRNSLRRCLRCGRISRPADALAHEPQCRILQLERGEITFPELMGLD